MIKLIEMDLYNKTYVLSSEEPFRNMNVHINRKFPILTNFLSFVNNPNRIHRYIL